jgi:cobaltochelatase CobS
METAAPSFQAGIPPSGLLDLMLPARELFRIDTDLKVPAFSTPDEHVPPVDRDYVFDRETTLALLAGFHHNRRR